MRELSLDAVVPSVLVETRLRALASLCKGDDVACVAATREHAPTRGLRSREAEGRDDAAMPPT